MEMFPWKLEDLIDPYSSSLTQAMQSIKQLFPSISPYRWNLPCWFSRTDRSPFSNQDPHCLVPLCSMRDLMATHSTESQTSDPRKTAHWAISKNYIYHTGLITEWIKHKVLGKENSSDPKHARQDLLSVQERSLQGNPAKPHKKYMPLQLTCHWWLHQDWAWGQSWKWNISSGDQQWDRCSQGILGSLS